MTPKEVIVRVFSEEFCDTLSGEEFAEDLISALHDEGYEIVSRKGVSS